ncbi:TPA: Golgi transport complex subunit 4 [Trebouxia sp. C0006]
MPGTELDESLIADISAVEKLTSLSDISRLLHDTLAKERGLEAELDQLLHRRGELEKGLLDLHAGSRETLEVVKAEAESLANSVKRTSNLSERVSRKVRELDTAQSRINGTLESIDYIVNRTNAVDGVQQALQTEDYEAAAQYVSTLLQSEDKYGKVHQDSSIKQSEQQSRILAEAQQELKKVVQAQLEEAVCKQEHDTVVRFVRLYAPLRMKDEGVHAFTEYVRNLIAERAREEYSALVESTGHSDNDTDFISALTGLFKDIATAVEENHDLLLTNFGATFLVEFTLGLQAECDVQGSRIVQRYIDHKKLQRLMKDISGFTASQRMEPGQPVTSIDPKQVAGHLEEMLSLAKSSEQYKQYMMGSMQDAMTPAPLDPHLEKRFHSGQFSVTIRELIAYYIAMEEFFMEQSVDKAISIDEWTGETLSSSMVDDVFYILRMCSCRALDTANLQALTAVLGQLNTLLASNLAQALDQRWKAGCNKLLKSLGAALGEAGLPSSGPSPTSHAAQHAAVLNNSDMASMYVQKLRSELEGSSSQMFPSASQHQRIKSVLTDLSKTASDLRHITSKALDHVANGLMPQLRPILDEVAQVQYELSDAEYAANEVEDTWVQSLLGRLGAYLNTLQPLLTPANYEQLVSLLLEKVIDRLDATMRLKRFNQLGGLQLDRDVRILTSTLADITQQAVRDHFARLSQMATILSLESVSEFLDYWGDSSTISWRFGEAQVREILQQRTDFLQDEIVALPLYIQ